MGQEIFHCTGCGLRLRSADFEHGDATRAEGATYCRPCAEQAGIPILPPTPSARSSQKSTGRIPVVTSSGGGSSRNSTSRIPVVTPRRGTEAVPSSPVSAGLLWGGVALGVVALLLAALVFGGRSAKPVEPEPAVVRVSPPPATDRGAAPVARSVTPDAPKPGTAAATASADLAALEKRVAEAVGRERFREAFDLLDSERKRHDSLEWTAAIQRATYGVDASAKKLYQELQAKAAAARLRGADAEAKAATDRIAAWGLPGYPAVPEPAPAAAPAVAAAAPPTAEPGAAVPAPIPVAPAPVKAAPAPFVPGPLKWSILKPLRATASGSRLTILEDGSLLAEGDLPPTDRYAVVIQTDLKGITAFRLEVLTDGSLPGSGPGRAFNGNFVLSEFQVQALPDAQAASGTPVVFERTAAEHGQEGFPIASVLDGRSDTGWALLPLVGRSHDAVFETKSPLPPAPAFLVVLDHQSMYVQHQIGRFRLSATTAKGAVSEMAARPPPVLDQAPVDAAIRRGLDWLLKGGSPAVEYPPDKKIGRIPNSDEFLLLTFLHSGVPDKDPRFQQLLASVLTGPYTHTYTVAIRAMALEELDRVRYQPHIARCAQFLLDNEMASGQWSYGEPSVAVESIRADVPAATSARAASASLPRTKPKIVQRISVRPTRTPPGNGDFSNSQYAALGLRACIDAGIIVPKEALQRASQAFTVAQLAPVSKEATPSIPSGRKPRGWCYDYPCGCPLHRPYGTMTSGAVSALAIYDHLLGRDAKKDAAILDGLAWLQVNYAIDTVPGPIEWDKISKSTYVPYYLYALERAMILTGNERLGTRAWYADGVRYLLETQKPDGSWAIDDWGRDTWDTCFALLFLKRSTRPLVASTDRFHPPDDDKK